MVETVEVTGVEPVFTVSLQPTTVVEGETITLSCTVTGWRCFDYCLSRLHIALIPSSVDLVFTHKFLVVENNTD